MLLAIPSFAETVSSPKIDIETIRQIFGSRADQEKKIGAYKMNWTRDDRSLVDDFHPVNKVRECVSNSKYRQEIAMSTSHGDTRYLVVYNGERRVQLHLDEKIAFLTRKRKPDNLPNIMFQPTVFDSLTLFDVEFAETPKIETSENGDIVIEDKYKVVSFQERDYNNFACYELTVMTELPPGRILNQKSYYSKKHNYLPIGFENTVDGYLNLKQSVTKIIDIPIKEAGTSYSFPIMIELNSYRKDGTHTNHTSITVDEDSLEFGAEIPDSVFKLPAFDSNFSYYDWDLKRDVYSME